MVGAAVATHHVQKREAQAQEREMTQAQIAQANAQADAAQAEAAAARAEAQKASSMAAQPAPQQPAPLQYPQQPPPVQYVQQPPPPPVQYAQAPQQQYVNAPYVSDPSNLHKPPVPSVPPALVAPVMLEVTTPHIVDENDPAMRQNQIISVPAGAIVSLHRGTLENGLGGPYHDYIEVEYQGKIGKISRHVVKRMEASIPSAIPGAIPAAIPSYTPA